MVSVEIRHLTTDLTDAPHRAATVGEVSLLYPLLSEDPLAFRRKALLVDSFLPKVPGSAPSSFLSRRHASSSATSSSSLSAASSHHHPSSQQDAAAEGEEGEEEEEVGQLLRYMKRVTWAERGGRSLSYKRPFKMQVLAHTHFRSVR